ncbi:hypothetical protein BGW80DRAFT_367115 [Lactifluus volemus]|nr:hypothetical protein BGW80DRAFT_367115 [Lactifluus volemus]
MASLSSSSHVITGWALLCGVLGRCSSFVTSNSPPSLSSNGPDSHCPFPAHLAPPPFTGLFFFYIFCRPLQLSCKPLITDPRTQKWISVWRFIKPNHISLSPLFSLCFVLPPFLP